MPRASLSRNDSVQVERLDLKPLNVRGTGPKRVEVNSLHLSVVSFSEQKRGSTAWTRLSRREFLAAAGGAAAAVALGAPAAPSEARSFLLSRSGCGRATGYAEASKIITAGDRTHVAWLDADSRGFYVRIRTLDRRAGTWSPTWTVGAAQDNHGGPGLIVDGRGFLHIVYYPHHASFRYRRSKRPNDASEWEPELQFGESLSYPVLLCTPDDTLLMTARRKFSATPEAPARPWELELWRKPAAGTWQRERALLRSRHGGYTHFQESLAWGADGRTIHLGCRIFETTGVKDETPLETAGYLMSPDAGKTWRRADGAVVALPATAETIDVLARGGGASGRTLFSGSLAVNLRGVPHLLHSVRENGRARSYLATPAPDGSGWVKLDLQAFLPEARRSRDLVMPGGLTFSASGRATMVATLVKLAAPTESDWAHPSSAVVRFWSDDDGRSFRSEVLEAPGAMTPHWLPNLERLTGKNVIPVEPGIIFTAGGGGAGLNELELNNEVWWRSANG
ncbi:MAG: twin-arginine translocation signal domain-containing protein [Opitutus sp.]|nr:twin-arginine translocation signal domain-containing protein [Opitutus sp.]